MWKLHPKQKKHTKIIFVLQKSLHNQIKRTNEKEIKKLHLCEINNHTQVNEISSFTENKHKQKYKIK